MGVIEVDFRIIMPHDRRLEEGRNGEFGVAGPR